MLVRKSVNSSELTTYIVKVKDVVIIICIVSE